MMEQDPIQDPGKPPLGVLDRAGLVHVLRRAHEAYGAYESNPSDETYQAATEAAESYRRGVENYTTRKPAAPAAPVAAPEGPEAARATFTPPTDPSRQPFTPLAQRGAAPAPTASYVPSELERQQAAQRRRAAGISFNKRGEAERGPAPERVTPEPTPADPFFPSARPAPRSTVGPVRGPIQTPDTTRPTTPGDVETLREDQVGREFGRAGLPGKAGIAASESARAVGEQVGEWATGAARLGQKVIGTRIPEVTADTGLSNALDRELARRQAVIEAESPERQRAGSQIPFAPLFFLPGGGEAEPAVTTAGKLLAGFGRVGRTAATVGGISGGATALEGGTPADVARATGTGALYGAGLGVGGEAVSLGLGLAGRAWSAAVRKVQSLFAGSDLVVLRGPSDPLVTSLRGDPYATLGLDRRTATPEQADAAFNNLAAKWHPEHNPDPMAGEVGQTLSAAKNAVDHDLLVRNAPRDVQADLARAATIRRRAAKAPRARAEAMAVEANRIEQAALERARAAQTERIPVDPARAAERAATRAKMAETAPAAPPEPAAAAPAGADLEAEIERYARGEESAAAPPPDARFERARAAAAQPEPAAERAANVEQARRAEAELVRTEPAPAAAAAFSPGAHTPSLPDDHPISQEQRRIEQELETATPEARPALEERYYELWIQGERLRLPPRRIGPALNFPTSEVHADPERFQMKTPKRLPGPWNPDAAGVMHVWHDPADNQVYAVNSHTRLDLAQREKVPRLPIVNFLDAPDAETARKIGAMLNIAEDQGSPVDIAKYLRESNTTLEDLERFGVPRDRPLAQKGLALTNLAPDIFSQVATGKIPDEWGIGIGQQIPNDPELQRQALGVIRASGKKLSQQEVRDVASAVSAEQTEDLTQEDIFGTRTERKSLYVPRAQLLSSLRRILTADKRLFGPLMREGRVEELETAGSTRIDVDAAAQRDQVSRRMEEIFNRVYTRAGPVAAQLTEGSRRISHGAKPGTVARELAPAIRAAIAEEIAQGPGGAGGAGGAPEPPARGGGPPEGGGPQDAEGVEPPPFADPDQSAFMEKVRPYRTLHPGEGVPESPDASDIEVKRLQKEADAEGIEIRATGMREPAVFLPSDPEVNLKLIPDKVLDDLLRLANAAVKPRDFKNPLMADVMALTGEKIQRQFRPKKPGRVAEGRKPVTPQVKAPAGSTPLGARPLNLQAHRAAVEDNERLANTPQAQAFLKSLEGMTPDEKLAAISEHSARRDRTRGAIRTALAQILGTDLNGVAHLSDDELLAAAKRARPIPSSNVSARARAAAGALERELSGERSDQPSLLGAKEGTAAARNLSETERAAASELEYLRQRQKLEKDPTKKKNLAAAIAERVKLLNRGKRISAGEMAERAAGAEPPEPGAPGEPPGERPLTLLEPGKKYGAANFESLDATEAQDIVEAATQAETFEGASRGDIERSIGPGGAKHVARLRARAKDVATLLEAVGNASDAEIRREYGNEVADFVEERRLPPAETFTAPAAGTARATQLELAFGTPAAARAAATLGLEANRVPTLDERLKIIPTGKQTWVDVRGKRLANAQDAALIGRPFRSPTTETLQYILTDDAGKILAREAITSGALGHVDADLLRDPARLSRRAQRVGATKLVIMHNHPSGQTVASAEDRMMTARVARALRAPKTGKPLEVSHYITDDETMGVLTVQDDGSVTARVEPIASTAPYGETDWTEAKGPLIAKPEDIVAMAGKVSDHEMHVIYRDASGRAIAMVPHRASAVGTMKTWLAQEARAVGADGAIIVTPFTKTGLELQRSLASSAPANLYDVLAVDHETGEFVSALARGNMSSVSASTLAFGSDIPARQARHVVGEGEPPQYDAGLPAPKEGEERAQVAGQRAEDAAKLRPPGIPSPRRGGKAQQVPMGAPPPLEGEGAPLPPAEERVASRRGEGQLPIESQPGYGLPEAEPLGPAPEQQDLLRAGPRDGAGDAIDISKLDLPETAEPKGGAREWMGRAVNSIIQGLNPEWMGKQARATADTFRHRGAEMWRSWAMVQTRMAPVDRALSAMEQRKQLKVWADFEAGRPSGIASLDATEALPALRRLTDSVTRALVQRDILQAEVLIENYTGRSWQVDPDVLRSLDAIRTRRPAAGPATFLKKRTWPSMLDGLQAISDAKARITAGKPLEGDERIAAMKPLTYNVVRSQMGKLSEMFRYIAQHDKVQDEMLAGRAQWVKVGEEPPIDAEGKKWIRVDPEGRDPAFVRFGPKELGGKIVPGRIVLGNLYAPTQSATIWQNAMSKGIRGHPVFGPLYEGYMAAGNATTQLILGFSGFHAATIAREGISASLELALSQALDRKTEGALTDVARSFGAPVLDAVFGRKVLQQYLMPGAHPELEPILKNMIEGGYRGTAENEWYTGDRMKKLRDAWHESWNKDNPKGRRAWNGLAIAPDAIFAALELQMKPLMQYYVPWMKAAATYRAIADELSKMPPNADRAYRRRRMSEVVKEMDYRFGQVVYDNYFMPRIIKDLAHGFFLAPGWTFGSATLLTRGLTQVPYRLTRTVLAGKGGKGGKGSEPNEEMVGRTTRYVLASVAGYMLVNGLMTYINTGEFPGDKDWWFARDGTKDPDGNANRFSIPGYEGRDWYDWPTHPVRTLLNKQKPFGAAFFRLMQNRDYFGNMYYDPDHPSVGDITKAAARELGTPITVKNIQEQRRRAPGSSAARGIPSIFGVASVKKEIQRTEAQNLIADYLARRGRTALTPAQQTRSQARADTVAMARRGEAPLDISAALQRRAETANLVSKFQSLTLDQAETVYARGEPWEQELWEPLLERKRASAEGGRPSARRRAVRRR